MRQRVDNFGKKDNLGIDKDANVGVRGSLCSRDDRVEERRPREPKPRMKTALISSMLQQKSLKNRVEGSLYYARL